MGYSYTLSFTTFQADDNVACLKAIREAEPEIGDYMEIVEGDIVFYPDDSTGKWRNAEDAVICVIKNHIIPGSTCTVYWQGEDDEMGGTLIGRDCIFDIVYEPMAVTEIGNIPLHEAKAILSQGSVTYRSSWNMHTHGPHVFFPIEEWRSDVANRDTLLGYQESVKHNLESLLHEIDLEGVNAIEVAGCAAPEVLNEADAEFFSVYTRQPGTGAQCECDFNTKAQALEFARALAARTGIPIYGNLCGRELQTDGMEADCE